MSVSLFCASALASRASGATRTHAKRRRAFSTRVASPHHLRANARGPGPVFVSASSATKSSSSNKRDAKEGEDASSKADVSVSRDESDRLSLDNVRASLIRQEDSVIFGLIERAQYKRNASVYEPGAVEVPCYYPDGKRASMLEFMLRESEQLGGKIRRYTSPDEHAFYPDSLPMLVIGSMEYKTPLHECASSININHRIMKMYVENLVPALCEEGDDNNYGSTGLADVTNLQTISKRIHYGKFVAESKFQARPEEFSELIRAQDAEGLMRLLTFQAVEDRVVRRVTNKAATYGQDISEDLPEQIKNLGSEIAVDYKIAPDQIGELYRKWIMPMTKDVQVEYLLRRLD